MDTFKSRALVATHSANSAVTDSAAAGTALACGVKTKNGMLGVDVSTNPVYSCAWAAKQRGMKVGIISTVMTTHATPGAFYAHQPNRGLSYEIAIELAHSGFEFFGGGGLDSKYKDPKAKSFHKYGHAYRYAESKGYRVVRTLKDFEQLKRGDGKVLTRFTDSQLPCEIEVREPRKTPSLKQLVLKAVEMLDGPEGFFIMAEGGRVDWASHANDPASLMHEILALDDAVKVALEFGARHPGETLILVTADHETGGLELARDGGRPAVDAGVLTNQVCSVGQFSSLVRKRLEKDPELEFGEIEPLIAENFGLKFSGDAAADKMVLAADEIERLKQQLEVDRATSKKKVTEDNGYMARKRYVFAKAVKECIDVRTGVKWNSPGHTGAKVLCTAKGCGEGDFTGELDNTDIAKKLKALLSSGARAAGK
jgi:alkaline phosphatase